jgi:DNA invertase Pin-like site-specific DNA recombinase
MPFRDQPVSPCIDAKRLEFIALQEARKRVVLKSTTPVGGLRSMKYVAYYRVSTRKQGTSGLGLEAQQEAVRLFLRPDDLLIESFTEVESGRLKERPRLEEAMALCRSSKGTLLIAKLDRLSRNLAFIATLMDDRTLQFKACDNPTADRTFMGMLAVFAEHEARV